MVGEAGFDDTVRGDDHVAAEGLGVDTAFRQGVPRTEDGHSAARYGDEETRVIEARRDADDFCRRVTASVVERDFEEVLEELHLAIV